MSPTPTPMPRWLVERLDAAGYIDAQMGASRKARALSCPRCGEPLLRALDADVCALTVDADPYPLAPESEALAALMEIPTFELSWRGDHYELDRRDQWRMRGRPASKPGVQILAAHRCGQARLPGRTPGGHRTVHSPAAYPDEPPF